MATGTLFSLALVLTMNTATQTLRLHNAVRGFSW